VLELTDTTEDLPVVTEHQPVEFGRGAERGAWMELALDGVALEPFLRPGERVWRWRWNPGPAVGLHRLTLLERRGEEQRRLAWALRVAPRKIDQERYETLLEDVQRAAYNIAYALAGGAAEGAALEREAPWQRSRLEEYYALFEGRLERFELAVRRIAARPREQLRPGAAEVPLGQAAGLDEAALARLPQGAFDEAPPELAAPLQEALRPGGGLLPRSVAAARSLPSLDTYEHRLLKHLLALLWRRAGFIAGLAEREIGRMAWNEQQTGLASPRLARAREIAAGCAAAQRLLGELRALPFLEHVAPLPAARGATALLQRDPHYREVYRMWQALRQHPFLAFDSPLFHIPITDLPRLYELWCALQVVQGLLAAGGALRQQRLVSQRQIDEAGDLLTTVALVEDQPLLVIAHGDLTLTLRYQARYRPAGGGRRTKDEGRRTNDQRPTTNDQRPTTDDEDLGSDDEGRVSSDEGASADGSSAGVDTGVDVGAGKLADAPTLKRSNAQTLQRSNAPALVSLDRHTRVPDLAIELERAGERRVLVLDAKYRLDAEGRGVPQDALSDAYAYQGAIGAAGRSAVTRALLLYPGSAPAELYPSGVGAIPLLPGQTGALDAILAELKVGW
jgi:large subunit ribosomal protein MRP49